MHEVVTVGMIVWPVVIVGGLLLVAAILIGLVALFNPFRSGH